MNSKDNKTAGFFNLKVAGRRKVLMVAGACMAAAAIALFAWPQDGPSDSLVKQVIEEEIAEKQPSPGAYDAEGAWEVESIDIVSKEKEDIEGFMGGALGDACYATKVKVSASNGHMSLDETMRVDFVQYKGTWQPFSSPSVESSTYRALSGPDKKKITQNSSDILRVVDEKARDREYQTLYAECTPKVSTVKFDDTEQTATANLAFKREDAFSSAKGDFTAKFAFKGGTWGLVDATAAQGANGVSYDKLKGTWKGAFKDTDAESGNCFGVQGKELTLKIASVDEASGKVEGTFQGIAHYHAYLDTDAHSTEGDAETGEIPFVATLEKSGTVGKRYGGMVLMNLAASFSAPETPAGEVLISFGFGTRDDPNAAIAKLATKASVKKGYKSQSMFEDTYTLTKAE